MSELDAGPVRKSDTLGSLECVDSEVGLIGDGLELLLRDRLEIELEIV